MTDPVFVLQETPTLATEAATARAAESAAQAAADAALGRFPITETDISDGAISTPKLAANAVTANEIAVGTITANEIAVGTITAAQLSADAIDGKVITGALFRNAATGRRVEIGDTPSTGFPDGEVRLYSGSADETGYGSLVVATPAADALVELKGVDLTSTPGPKIFLRTKSAEAQAGAEIEADLFSVFVAQSVFYGPIEGTDTITIDGVPVLTTTGAQAVTNKDLTGAGNTFPSSLATLTGTQTLTNKTIPLADTWHEVGNATTGLGMVFQNGYSNSGIAGYPNARIIKTPFGEVWVQGRIVVTTANALTPFTLPVGYRPPVITTATVSYGNAAGNSARMNINPDGTFVWITAPAAATTIYLDLRFLTV